MPVEYYTEEGLRQLQEELHYLLTTRRKEVAKAIEEAREKGDLSENAEYDAAKEEQAQLESKIYQLQKTLANARVLTDDEIDTSKVFILSKVKVKNLGINKEEVFTLVSPPEANLAKKKLSVKSPIGEALLGKEVGDIVSVKVPAGTIKFEILEISR